MIQALRLISTLVFLTGGIVAYGSEDAVIKAVGIFWLALAGYLGGRFIDRA